MVGGFTLPSLPSLPQGLVDFLDTSPQVFYPSRPSSRAGPSSTSTSCPSSPAPRRRQRPLSMGDARILFVPPSPLPPFNCAPHPHTDSPLEATRSDRRNSATESTYSDVSTPASPSLSESTSRRPAHAQHRRSQSAAPLSAPFSAPVKSRGLAELRNSITSASSASLPRLEESVEGDRDGSPSPLAASKEPLWVQATLRRTQTLPRGRRGAPQPLTPSTMIPPSESAGTGRSTLTISTSSVSSIPPATHQRSNSTISFGSPRRSRIFVRHQSANSVVFPEVPLSPSPVPVCASTSVSDIAALATWSQAPTVTVQPSRLSRSQSVTSPSERLRDRLRSLNQLEPIHSPPHANPPSPSTPRSTHGTPGHGTPTGPPPELRAPGSCTPTSSSHGHAPSSPTPRRRRPPHLTHNHRHSLPDALVLVPEPIRAGHSNLSMNTSQSSNSNSSHSSHSSHAAPPRPTTSRLRQPPQLSMAMEMLPPLFQSVWPRNSLLEPQASPILSSSPSSMESDTSSATEASSPTNSFDELSLGSAFSALRERELNRDFGVIDKPSLIDLTDRRGSDTRRRSRDLRELVELRESLRHSTSSSRTCTRSQSLRESSRSSLRESLNQSTRSSRCDTQTIQGHGYGTSHAHIHHLHSSTSSYIRDRRDSLAKDRHPTHGTRVVLSTYDPEIEDRFLDFDDI